MKPFLTLPLALCLLFPLPTTGQDFLGQFEEFVESFADEPVREAPRAAPTAPVVAPVAVPPPVPRPRPPSLPDGAVEVEAAPVEPDVVAPQPEPVAAEPVEPVEPPEAAPLEAAPAPVEEPEVPDRVYQAACPAVIAGLVEAEITPPLSEGICGERSPLTVTAVLVRGRMVPLSSPVVTNCAMASALPGWLDTVDGYADAMLESPLASVDTSTSYMCRNRNNASDGFTSEHGFANAVDISGFTLEDGRSIGVETHWAAATAPEGRLLRLAHDAACAGFTTVLGPEANAEHADHLHLDLGCHGQTCTARICE